MRFSQKKTWLVVVFVALISVLSILFLRSNLKDLARIFHLELSNNGKTNIAECGLNVHIWDGICLEDLERICKLPIFPKGPALREIANTSRIMYPFRDIVVRVFGFIQPPVTGTYRFSVDTPRQSSFVLLLNTGHGSTNIRRISRNSDKVLLQEEKEYYLELIYAQGSKDESSATLMWQTPDEEEFCVIDSRFLSVYMNDRNKRTLKMYDSQIPSSFICESSTCLAGNHTNLHFEWERVEYIEHEEVGGVLPRCEYKPSYVINRGVRYKWESVNHLVFDMEIWQYPLPHSKELYDRWQWPYPLNQNTAMKVTQQYMDNLERKFPGKYSLASIKSVEQKVDKKNGYRYLLELNLQRKADGKMMLLSEYVFQRKNDSSLCYPNGVQWNKTAEIYFVVTAKNQGRWLHHLIKNMARIYKETNDQNFHLVICDYESKDIDIKDVLRKNQIPRYTVISESGDFIKTKAYNEAVSSVKDPNAIIFLVDLHLEIASGFLDSIRKHCFQGRTTFTPVLARLACGYFPDDPRGLWEAYGYGPIGTYKSDWDRFGGFTKHRKGWGGEDWDIMDNIVESRLEFERMRTPYLFHYYHNKKGMWI